MSQRQNTQPKGFFSLPRELRDKIYDLVHGFREEVNFGINHQLKARFPLPRLHHISRHFRDEYDSRTPCYSQITISPTGFNFDFRHEQVHLPKIVHLRAMQTHQAVDKLCVELHICDEHTSYDEIHEEIAYRVKWIANLVFNVCTSFNDVFVSLIVRFPQDIVHAVKALRAVHDLTFCTFAGEAELIFQGTIGQDTGDSEVTSIEDLGTWSRATRKWDFDFESIAKCESAVGIAGIYTEY